MISAPGLRSRASAARDSGVFTVVALAMLLAVGPPAAAQVASDQAGVQVIAADKASQLAAAGEMVVVDVRSPQEWHQTGVPAGAKHVTIHQPDGMSGFLAAMNEALGPNHNRPVALICAGGTRSTLASTALADAGYTHVYNIREGMLGSADGPGWLARGLPTEPCGKC